MKNHIEGKIGKISTQKQNWDLCNNVYSISKIYQIQKYVN